MPSFLIAEDHGVVRMGMVLIIKSVYPDACITETETFDEALEQLQSGSFDLLLLDLHIPGGDNIQMIDAVKQRQPKLPILIFSGYDEHIYALRYLKAGAQGYLSKRAGSDAIKTAIKQVLNGQRYLSPQVQDKLLNNHLYPQQATAGAPLSKREKEVMQLLIRGAGGAEIKNALNIRSSTISTHKARIFEKMEVSNIVDLAAKIKMQEAENTNK